MDSLDSLRQQLDTIDTDLVDLLAERFALAKKIGDYKRENDMSPLQPTRWKQVLKSTLQHGSKKGISETCIHQIWEAIHMESLRRQ